MRRHDRPLARAVVFTYVAEMRTVGVDLAAEAKNTWRAVIDWSDERPSLVHLGGGETDESIVNARARGDAVGIDCPFGWPEAFRSLVKPTKTFARPPLAESIADRRSLCFRVTDDAVLRRTGRQVKPLSVSANLLGATAMRCNGLLWKLGGAEFDRTGSRSPVYEVYPAAALWCWANTRDEYGVWRRYKKDLEARTAIASWLCDELLIDPREVARIAKTDHGLDAVLAAVTARAAHLGRTVPCPSGNLEAARSEGWIHLPKNEVRLRDLVAQ